MTDNERDELLIRLDERMRTLTSQLPTFVSCDRVDALEDRVDYTYNKIADHVKDHEALAVNRNLIAGSYMTGVAAIAAALVAIFRKGG